MMAARDRTDRRRNAFKKGIDAEESRRCGSVPRYKAGLCLGVVQILHRILLCERRKREDNIVELRKSKRDENLQKKRMVFAAGHDSGTMEDSTRGAGMQQKVSATAHRCHTVLIPQRCAWFLTPMLLAFAIRWHIASSSCCFVQLESLPTMVQGVWSEDPKSQLEATAQFRKLLSIGELLRDD